MFEKKRTRGLRVTFSGNQGRRFKINGKAGEGDPPPILKTLIMENNWEPRVGQKVVALKSGVTLVKGRVYEVKDVRPSSCKCKGIEISIGEPQITGYLSCPDCNSIYKNDTPCKWFHPYLFAPLPEQYADMTSEIAQQFKEHPDTVDQPVKVLETSN